MARAEVVEGTNLRAWREARDLSIVGFVERLADEEGVKVGVSHISNIEANRRNASPALIGAMARVLRVQRTQLLKSGAA